MSGYNCGLLVFGETGSGKAQTLSGSRGTDGVLAPLLEDVFKGLDSDRGQMSATVHCWELHNELLVDLLNPANKRLSVSESASAGYQVQNITTREVGDSRLAASSSSFV